MTTRDRNETPDERFRRVTEARTNSVIDKLRLLGNCSNRRIYSYTKKDVDRIFLVINKQLKEVRFKFNSTKQDKFSFKW